MGCFVRPPSDRYRYIDVVAIGEAFEAESAGIVSSNNTFSAWAEICGDRVTVPWSTGWCTTPR
jgi:hypothetical protein